MANRGINKAIILGHLGSPPEIRHLPNGTVVAILSVATSDSWIDKQTGHPQERTEWHRIEAIGKLAEIMKTYLQKGAQVYIEGSIHTDKWTDKQGQTRYSTKIRANQMQMLGGRVDNRPDTLPQRAPKETVTKDPFTPKVADDFDKAVETAHTIAMKDVLF